MQTCNSEVETASVHQQWMWKEKDHKAAPDPNNWIIMFEPKQCNKGSHIMKREIWRAMFPTKSYAWTAKATFSSAILIECFCSSSASSENLMSEGSGVILPDLTPCLISSISCSQRCSFCRWISVCIQKQKQCTSKAP